MDKIIFDFNIKISKFITKDLDNEIWKEINIHTNYIKYFISNYGRIKSITNKRIIQLDKNNNIINIFNSISEASKEFNIKKTGIQNVLKGYSKYYKGYIFKYDV